MGYQCIPSLSCTFVIEINIFLTFFLSLFLFPSFIKKAMLTPLSSIHPLHRARKSVWLGFPKSSASTASSAVTATFGAPQERRCLSFLKTSRRGKSSFSNRFTTRTTSSISSISPGRMNYGQLILLEKCAFGIKYFSVFLFTFFLSINEFLFFSFLFSISFFLLFISMSISYIE